MASVIHSHSLPSHPGSPHSTTQGTVDKRRMYPRGGSSNSPGGAPTQNASSNSNSSSASSSSHEMTQKERILATAIENRDRGNVENYLIMVQMLAQGQQLGHYYELLSRIPTYIRPHLTELIDVIFSLDWFKYDEATLLHYSEFLLNLNSAHGGAFLDKTFSTLVDTFRARTAVVNGRAVPTSAAHLDGVLNIVHTSLKKILWMIPTSPTQLWPALADAFPHRTFDADAQRMYLTNCLHVADYCPALKERIILLIVDKLIQIDVEIKIDDRDEFEPVVDDDEDDGSGSDFVFSMELQGGQRGPSNMRGPAGVPIVMVANKTEQALENQEAVNKLDVMMDIVFTFLTSRNPEDWDDYFRILLKAFDKIILPTHRSKFTQFVVFYFCRAKPDFGVSFVDHLFGITDDEQRPMQLRQAAAAYIGSFMGRANFLSSVCLQRAVSKMVLWLREYINLHPNQTPDTDRHGLFYHIAQSAIYILTFHHKVLTETFETHYIRNLGLEHIIFSSMNPLKLCVQSVVHEFVKIARSHGVKVSNILQRNERCVIPTKTAFGSANIFEAFFPFDPYLLTISARYINPLYQHWERKSDTGYDTDQEMDLDDEVGDSANRIDDDDDSQRNSMMQMMDYGRGSYTGGSMKNSFEDRRGSYGRRSSFGSGSFDGKPSFAVGSSGGAAGNFFLEDQDLDSSGGNSPASRPGSYRTSWNFR